MDAKEVMKLPPGPEIDFLVAEKIMEWKSFPKNDGGFWADEKNRTQMILDSELHNARKRLGIDRDRPGNGFVFAPSRDWGSALEVIAKVRTRYFSGRLEFTKRLQAVVSERLEIQRALIDPSEIVLTMEPIDICRAALLSHKWREG